MHRILAAVDLSDSTQPILHYSADLARNENATLAVIHAIPATAPLAAVGWGGGPGIAVSPEEERAEYESSLGLLHQLVESTGLPNVDCVCERGSPVEMIREAAERVKADLIVMGSHGHGRFFHTMFGSVREALLSQAPCPVLVVPTHVNPS